MSEWYAVGTEIAVGQEGGGLCDDTTTRVRVGDEGGGPFLSIVQGGHEVTFDVEEWPHIVSAAKVMLESCGTIRARMIPKEAGEK